MRYAPLVERIGAQPDGTGPEAWGVHYAAATAQRRGETVRGEPIIVMSVGDPDLDTPRIVSQAAVAGLEAGDTHYTPIAGREALRATIARRFRDQAGGDCGPENVIVAAGAQNALFGASLCVAGPGDEIVAFEPMYVSYTTTAQVSGATLVRAAMGPEIGFRPTRAALEAVLTPRTRAILLATPNNPTGVMMTPEEAEAIAAVAIERDLWVISDEVYAEIGFAREHVSIAALPGMADRTVTLGSLSKSHAMTGWRIGWAIAPTEMIGHLDNLGLCMLYGLPGFNQSAAIAALTDAAEGGAWEAAAEMREIYRARRDVFVDAVNRIEGLCCANPEGGMFALVDVRGTGLSAHDFSQRLFEERGVSVLEGAPFGPSTDGFVRVSFALSEADLEVAAARMAAFVRDL